jgi:hypothetical protein
MRPHPISVHEPSYDKLSARDKPPSTHDSERGSRTLSRFSHGGVMMPCGVLQPALVLQKRRRLREKDATGAQDGTLDGVSGVWPLCAMVRQRYEPSVPEALEASQPKECIMGPPWSSGENSMHHIDVNWPRRTLDAIMRIAEPAPCRLPNERNH